MKTQDFLTSKQTSELQNHPNLQTFIQQASNQKDLFSNKSNLGSDQSSLRSNQNKQLKKTQNHSQTKKISQQSQQNVYEWQAVYIQGKFYLSDKQTVQRYFDIQNQLKQQRQTKDKITKIPKNLETNNNDPNLQAFGQMKTSQRLFNLQTIKVREESQSDKQKQQDESLLNNLDTSSQNCSRLTFQMQTPESESIPEPIIKRIDQISSIGKSHKDQIHIDENQQNIPTDQISKPRDGDNLKTISQKQSQSSNQFQKKEKQYGYYLSPNNQKVYSKKSQNQDIENLQSFRQEESADFDVNQPDEESRFESKDQESHPQNFKAESLQAQQKIQLPINLQTNRLKISSPFSSISSFSNPQKEFHLAKITQEREEEIKRSRVYNENSSKNPSKSIKSKLKAQNASFQYQAVNQKNLPLPVEQKIELSKDKRFSSLSLKFNVQNISIPSKSSFKTYENIKQSKVPKVQEFSKSNSFYSNNQHINLVDSGENSESLLDQSQSPQKAKNFRTTELLSKLSELSKRKQLSHRSQNRGQSQNMGFFKPKNTHFELSNKYQLPQIFSNTERNSVKQVKANSIDQKYRSIQKDDQFKLFEKADQMMAQQDLSKSKNRLNGFIKNMKISSEQENEIQNESVSIKQKNLLNFKQDEQNKSIKGMSRSIRSRSSFMTRNYNASSPNQKDEAEVFGQNQIDREIKMTLNNSKYHKKSEAQIGLIKCMEQQLFEPMTEVNQLQAQHFKTSNDNKNTQFLKETKKDTAVSANLDSDDKVPFLNPQIKSLRQNKQLLLQKLQNLQKKDLENQINQIKQSIKEIEILKLNKMAKTIDLSDRQDTIQIIPEQQTQQYQTHLKNILKKIPQPIQKLTKPTQIAEIKVPQEIILSKSEFKISQNMTPQQLQQLAIRVYKLFGIQHDPNYRPPSLLTMMQKPQLSFKQKEKLLIKKFKNCVFFEIVGGENGKVHNKTIVWNFNPESSSDQNPNQLKPIVNFYIGGWTSTVETDLTGKGKEKQLGKGKKNGFGLQINQKFIYEGQYLNGKKHGQGKLYLIESGYRYEGQFIENHKFGHGKEFNPFKNQIYIGQFKQDKRHGKGYLKRINLKSRNEKNKKQAKVLSFPYFFNGTFVNGNKQSGHQFFQNGDEYKGEYLNDMFHQKGVFKWMNGAQYDGEFLKNFKQGFGKWSSASDLSTGAQSFYIGQFKENMKHGEGKYIYKNGAYYQGSFENDLKHGSGALFYESQNKQSKVLRGYWKQGNIVANEKGQIYKMKMQRDEIEISIHEA